jgi:hypothetical protein
MLSRVALLVFACSIFLLPCASTAGTLPLVINTWPFVESNVIGEREFKPFYQYCENACLLLILIAASAVANGSGYLDAIEKGCSAAERNTSIDSVGYGGR